MWAISRGVPRAVSRRCRVVALVATCGGRGRKATDNSSLERDAACANVGGHVDSTGVGRRSRDTRHAVQLILPKQPHRTARKAVASSRSRRLQRIMWAWLRRMVRRTGRNIRSSGIWDKPFRKTHSYESEWDPPAMVKNSVVTACFALFVFARFASAEEGAAPAIKDIQLDSGIRLNYIEAGSGTPVIFIHGTLGDMYMWTSFIESFGKDYRAIAYSRRYNHPNRNPVPPMANHSTGIEAEDLAEFITKLQLPKAHVVGYSYGGYTALHLAVNHPDLIRTLVVAEPPLLPWLANMPGHQDKGREMLDLQETRFVNPARNALKEGKEEEAIRIFIDYVISEGAFNALPAHTKHALLRNAPEFVAEVMSENMFAPLSREDVASLTMPVLMISGENSIGPLRLTDAELEKTLPQQTTKRVIIPNATHAMWYENPAACTSELSEFFRHTEIVDNRVFTAIADGPVSASHGLPWCRPRWVAWRRCVRIR